MIQFHCLWSSLIRCASCGNQTNQTYHHKEAVFLCGEALSDQSQVSHCTLIDGFLKCPTVQFMQWVIPRVSPPALYIVLTNTFTGYHLGSNMFQLLVFLMSISGFPREASFLGRQRRDFLCNSLALTAPTNSMAMLFKQKVSLNMNLPFAMNEVQTVWESEKSEKWVFAQAYEKRSGLCSYCT